ncbi:MAG: lysine--tRNA ligase, partial [Clostridia bacterium]|nr:lysine--tRNA ligase [Clostridia bacterium]
GLDELNTKLYDVPKKVFGEDAENLKALQGDFFKSVYRLLLGKDKGPRLYLFLYAIDKESYLHLLDFSTPMTEEEKAPKAVEAVEEEEQVFGEPDPIAPIKPEMTFDDFAKADFRVCRILKCIEIRKSHSCYKLTVFDGLKERVIVSSIKHYYKPEQLIGKKIIVAANLAPTRITGVTSEGMLLAATNNACGCKVIFVDDAVPEGTAIC